MFGSFGRASSYCWFDGGNLAVQNGNVNFALNVVFRIEDLPVAKNKIEPPSVPGDGTSEESCGHNVNHRLGTVIPDQVQFRVCLGRGPL